MKGKTMANQMAEMMESAQDDGAQSSGYQICINVGGDGKITVGVETGDYEAAEQTGAQSTGAAGPEEMKPAANFRDAMQMAMDIYRSNGKMGADDQEAADFKAGFGKRNKSPMVDKYQEDQDEMM